LNGFAAVVAAVAAWARNRNPIPWFFFAAAFPLFGLAMLFALGSLGPDGTPPRLCCAHCPHRTEDS
jgi:hypothetical protein